jgi:hypothetical protein
MANKIRIKILAHQGEYCDEHDHHILRGCTDWEEVDADTYHKLVGWCAMKNRVGSYDDVRYCIFTEEKFNFMQCVQEYVDHIEAEERKRAEVKRKRDQARRLKAAAKNKLAEAQERKLLEDLKKKYEDRS